MVKTAPAAADLGRALAEAGRPEYGDPRAMMTPAMMQHTTAAAGRDDARLAE
jgi:hypothetical protein